MGRYTGPKERLSRREGVELFLKGERALNGKSALERRGATPPGQHGQARRRKPSTYSVQLRAKQLVKAYYGVRERQFRRYVEKAARTRTGTTGENLLELLERRLDNVVYRLGFATTRAQARQFVGHGHITVDGQRVDIASFAVRPGQLIAIKDGSPITPVATEAAESAGSIPAWLESDVEQLRGRVVRLPVRSEVTAPVEEQLVVEFYSRR